jgi:hypothetical protein
MIKMGGRRWHLVRTGTRFWVELICGHFGVVPRCGRPRPAAWYECQRCAEEASKNGVSNE